MEDAVAACLAKGLSGFQLERLGTSTHLQALCNRSATTDALDHSFYAGLTARAAE